MSDPMAGQYIKKLRTERGWTQQEASGKIGVSNAMMGYLETGRRALTDRVAIAS